MIEIKDLSVIYDAEVQALDHLDLDIKEDTCTFIIGQNGSGKSTLLSSLVGIIDTSGSVKINDTLVNKDTLLKIRNEVGLVFQNPDHQLFMNTVYDDLAFGLINQGKEKQEVEYLIKEIAKQLHIEHLLHRSSIKLSGGQKRIVALATVLVMKPKVILMDEPSSFLDPLSRRKIINIIKELKHTIVIASHDLDMAIDIGGSVVLLNNGKVVGCGNTQEMLTNKEVLEDNGLELPYRYQGE